jgi:hypothetical protein
MNPDTPRYYQPYESGEDTDNTDTDADTDVDADTDDYDSEDLPDFEDIRIRREEDPRYALIRTAGPNFNTSAEQLKYMEHAPGSSYDNDTNITSLQNYTYLNPPKTTQTSLFSVKSLNRDAVVFQSPFNFEIKTPRVYKNVTKFQLVQISFPNNTLNFNVNPAFKLELFEKLITNNVSIGCLSTCLEITGCETNFSAVAAMERGRFNNGYPFMIKFSIPPGSYTNQKIADTLNQTSNNTPPFNIISYQDFKNEFQIHRDISILFNESGDKYYSNVKKTFYYNHTKEDIMNSYYTQHHIDSFPNITDAIAFNAYYYPILKEALINPESQYFIDTSPYSFSQAYDFVVAKFLGLNSNIYFDLCTNNQSRLDRYRKQLTFELTPINKYIWSYNENSKQFSVSHNSLHTSLQNDITNKYNSLYNHHLSLNNLTNKSFQLMKTQYAHSRSVFNELQSNLSSVLFAYGYGSNYKYTGGINHTTDTHTLNAVNDLNNDGIFSSMFIYSSIFGGQFHSNFHGHKLNFNNFLDYHSTMSSYYNNIITTSSFISSLTGTINNSHHNYVSTKYSSVLPYSIINNKTYNNSTNVPVFFINDRIPVGNGLPIKNNYLRTQSVFDAAPGFSLSDTDPCIASCCEAIEKLILSYYSCIPVESVTSNYPNSLAYRLGIPLINLSNFSFTSSIFNTISSSNFNVLLQLNTEYPMNNMDIAMNEEYRKTNETTGQVDLMCAKILMQGVGSGEVSETAIQNPILFETPLGKLSKLTFKMYADDTAITPLWQAFPFDIGINEWDATFQIDEEVGYADRNAGFGGNIPTIPIPKNPEGFQYMGLVSSGTTLNK